MTQAVTEENGSIIMPDDKDVVISMNTGNFTNNQFNIGCEKISQRKYLFSGIPVYNSDRDDFDYIDVVMRKLMRKDKSMLKGLDFTAPESIGRVVSILVEKWGEKDHITSIELELDKYEEALEALNFCFIQVLQPSFSLVSVR